MAATTLATILDSAGIAARASARLKPVLPRERRLLGEERKWVARAGASGYRFPHGRCIDWRSRPFVYARQIDELRSVLRRGLVPVGGAPCLRTR